MAERFERLFMLPDNLYSHGSPIIVVAGTLLRDTQTGKIIAQIKFKNISGHIIKAVKIQLVEYDVMGKEIDGICEYQYLDLHVNNGDTFGSNKAILMSNGDTRSYSIHLLQIVMDDDSVNTALMPLTALPIKKDLGVVLQHPELLKQFRLEVNDQAAYAPQEVSCIWSCSCGEWNGTDICSNCHVNKEVVFSIFDPEVIIEKAKNRLRKEKAEKQEESEQRKHVEEKDVVQPDSPINLPKNDLSSITSVNNKISAKIILILIVTVTSLSILLSLFISNSDRMTSPSKSSNSSVSGSLTEEEKILLGNWHTEYLDSDGEMLTADMLSAIGKKMETICTAKFNSDYSGTINFDGDETSIQWKFDTELQRMFVYSVKLGAGNTTLSYVTDKHSNLYGRLILSLSENSSIVMVKEQ